MDFPLFPNEYKRQRDIRVEQEIQEEKSKSNAKIESINNSVGTAPQGWDEVLAQAEAAIAFAFLAYCGCCCLELEVDRDLIATLSVCAGTVVFLIGLTMILSGQNAYQKATETASANVCEESKRCNDAIELLTKRAQQDCEEYAKNFEQSVQEKSVHFVKGSLVQMIAEQMASIFSKYVDTADRRKHIPNINIPFSFQVFRNKITFPLGTFDFEIERCRALGDCAEQAALSMAIASSVQTDIVMKYPQDKSGTDIDVSIRYTYGGEYGPATATITYSAPNGNFMNVQDWQEREKQVYEDHC